MPRKPRVQYSCNRLSCAHLQRGSHSGAWRIIGQTEWHQFWRRGTPPYMLPTAIKDPNRAAACDAYALLGTLRDVLAHERLDATLKPQYDALDWRAVAREVLKLPRPMRRSHTQWVLPHYLGMMEVPEVRLVTLPTCTSSLEGKGCCRVFNKPVHWLATDALSEGSCQHKSVNALADASRQTSAQ